MRALLAPCLVLPTMAPAFAQADFQSVIRPFLETHCIECHGPAKQKARLRYDQIEGYQQSDQHLWTKVHEMLRTGEMPPEEQSQPGEAERQSVLDWIEANQRSMHTASTRRLNRRELSAALRDLTGLSVDYAAGLPGDGTVDGFDTGSEALQDAGDSIAQIMEVSRRAVEGIRFLDPPTGQPLILNLDEEQYERDIRRAFSNLKDLGFESRGKDAIGVAGEGIFVSSRWTGDRDKFSISAPAPVDGRGVLRLRFSVGAMKPYPKLPNPHLWVQVGGKTIDILEITNHYEAPRTFTYDVQIEDVVVQKGSVEIALRSVVEMPYAIEGFENDERAKPEDNVPGGTGLFRPRYDRKQVPWKEAPVPYLVFDRIAIDPDHVAPWPPADWNVSLQGLNDHPEQARALLHLWTERAWRRPVTEEELTPFLTFYRELRTKDLSFDAALRATFQSVLLSGPFRFLASPADQDELIARHALASRLSFMLTGSPPDAALRDLAATGRLRKPAALEGEIDRLLDSPTSRDFWNPFITQWLVLDQPITLAMDHIKKQDFRFGRFLKESMREQTLSYVAQLFADNRPARELIQSDWTMMNNSLARHHGYDGIEGGHFRKVVLRAGDPRGGGLLGHAGIQSMLCWMGDNWVIYRGAWTMRHILDNPPPPPPLEVPELDPDAGENRGKTMRELLIQHQEEENCAVCHRKMDPVGFAFQNFDLSGRWRTLEHDHYHRYELDGKIEWRGEGSSRPVDAAGVLPRGEAFRDFAEFKELITNHYLSDMVEGLLKNLSLYGTGRQPDVRDRAIIRAIMEDHREAGYPLRDLLKALLQSEIFLES